NQTGSVTVVRVPGRGRQPGGSVLTALVLVILLVLVIGVVMWSTRRRAAAEQEGVEDAKAEARRWIERLGGQVYNLDGASDPAAKQALADAGERYNAAGS